MGKTEEGRLRTLDAANGHWKKILTHLGVDAEVLRNKHSTCPVCAGKDKFRFDNKEGLGTWICNTCGAGYGYRLAQLVSKMDSKDLLAEIDTVIGHRPSYSKPVADQDAVRRASNLHRFARELRDCGTITASYLRNRGVGLSQMSFIREHPRAPYFEDGQLLGHYPAMVNAMRDGSGDVITFHVTYLCQDGLKARVSTPKKIMPPIRTITGSAIRLCSLHEQMAITEGIETALGVMTYEKVPCWAAYSANNLAKFDPPDGIRSLLIYGDRDRSYTGQAAAYELARRMQSRGVSVDVALPPDVGQDWLDYWAESA